MLKTAYQEGYIATLVKLGIAPVEGALKYLRGGSYFKPLIEMRSKIPTAPKFSVNLKAPNIYNPDTQLISLSGLDTLSPTGQLDDLKRRFQKLPPAGENILHSTRQMYADHVMKKLLRYRKLQRPVSRYDLKHMNTQLDKLDSYLNDYGTLRNEMGQPSTLSIPFSID